MGGGVLECRIDVVEDHVHFIVIFGAVDLSIAGIVSIGHGARLERVAVDAFARWPALVPTEWTETSLMTDVGRSISVSEEMCKVRVHPRRP